MLSLLNEYVGVAMTYYFLITFGIVAIVIAKIVPEGIIGLVKKLVAKFFDGKRQGSIEEKS